MNPIQLVSLAALRLMDRSDTGVTAVNLAAASELLPMGLIERVGGIGAISTYRITDAGRMVSHNDLRETGFDAS